MRFLVIFKKVRAKAPSLILMLSCGVPQEKKEGFGDFLRLGEFSHDHDELFLIGGTFLDHVILFISRGGTLRLTKTFHDRDIFSWLGWYFFKIRTFTFQDIVGTFWVEWDFFNITITLFLIRHPF